MAFILYKQGPTCMVLGSGYFDYIQDSPLITTIMMDPSKYVNYHAKHISIISYPFSMELAYPQRLNAT